MTYEEQDEIIELELQNKKEEVKNVNKSFGEVYKSYVIHTLKLYEDIINDNSISEENKKQLFESKLSEYLISEKEKTNKFISQQITDPKKIQHAQTEMFLGSESLNFESVGNLYKTFIEDLNLVANDSEGKMYSTVPNDKELEFDNQGNLITKVDYNFDRIKEIYDFAKEHGKQIKFHTFLWHNAIPENLKQAIDNVSDQTLKRNMALSFLKDYASNLSSFIEGNGYDLKQVEVLNEIASDKSDDTILRNSWWKDVIGKNPINGDEYFIDVLKIVKEKFPSTELTYNDYNEYIPYKCDKMCEIVKYIQEIEKRDNTKLLDGLGVQAHYTDWIKDMNQPLTVDMIKQSAFKFMELGIPIYVSEFDYNTIANKDNLEKDKELKQAFIKYYAGIANGFNMWGNSDRLTWGYTMEKDPTTGEYIDFRNSHMIDANGVPKEIYKQVKQEIGLLNNDKEKETGIFINYQMAEAIDLIEKFDLNTFEDKQKADKALSELKDKWYTDTIPGTNIEIKNGLAGMQDITLDEIKDISTLAEQAETYTLDNAGAFQHILIVNENNTFSFDFSKLDEIAKLARKNGKKLIIDSAVVFGDRYPSKIKDLDEDTITTLINDYISQITSKYGDIIERMDIFNSVFERNKITKNLYSEEFWKEKYGENYIQKITDIVRANADFNQYDIKLGFNDFYLTNSLYSDRKDDFIKMIKSIDGIDVIGIQDRFLSNENVDYIIKSLDEISSACKESNKEICLTEFSCSASGYDLRNTDTDTIDLKISNILNEVREYASKSDTIKHVEGRINDKFDCNNMELKNYGFNISTTGKKEVISKKQNEQMISDIVERMANGEDVLKEGQIQENTDNMRMGFTVYGMLTFIAGIITIGTIILGVLLK